MEVAPREGRVGIAYHTGPRQLAANLISSCWPTGKDAGPGGGNEQSENE